MTSANEDQNPVASAKTDSETSANKYPENPAVDESEKTSLEDMRQDKGEVALDPHPSQALKELVTGDESSSTDA
ncbi:hypothetical protein [Chroococcidiopsis sp. CCMEE 29]|jgi:hypothetical protein|uniref:hypothetical protein n=1 Tax=Chroococcidiopsis sp. CCMEE 29 TaxID=155894 RepID=UPI0020204B3F|nr:hypothetical protein [Chroococcidiopsis sp. CCMEE 29]